MYIKKNYINISKQGNCKLSKIGKKDRGVIKNEKSKLCGKRREKSNIVVENLYD